MSTTFRPYVPDQSLLLPPDVREWLPEGHLAHHVSDLVDGLDLTAFYALYEGDGRRNAAYEPRMMVKVLLYAYATGVFSSRRVARKLEEDVGFRVLAAGNFPQHRTLCEFRRRHLEDFQALFVEVVRLAQELGLARLGKLSIDGTKVRANASKRKAMSYDRMQAEEQRLESEVEALLRQADAVDEAEDSRLGAEVRGDDLPAELRRREERLAAIREAKARLEAAARAADAARGRQPGQDRNPKGGRPYKRAYGEPDEKSQSNFTDPESSIMKTSNEGFQQCYNAQVTVDAEHQLVVATDLTANASDQGELPVLLDAVKETFAAQPETVLADAGYCNERDLTDLEKRGIDGYVAPGREGKQTATRDLKAHPATGRMVEKLATPAGRTAYAERKWLSEAPNGWIKHVLGFRRFSLRCGSRTGRSVIGTEPPETAGRRRLHRDPGGQVPGNPAAERRHAAGKTPGRSRSGHADRVRGTHRRESTSCDRRAVPAAARLLAAGARGLHGSNRFTGWGCRSHPKNHGGGNRTGCRRPIRGRSDAQALRANRRAARGTPSRELQHGSQGREARPG